MSGPPLRRDGVFGAGEFLLVGFEGIRPTEEIGELVLRHRLGGVILYGRNCADPLQVRAMAADLQRLAAEGGHEHPLLVAVDQEGGRVARLKEGVTLFPPAAELARLGDPPLVERVAAAVSRELLAAGVNWNLAPVADVVTTPASPLGDRSFGGDPRQTADMVAAWVRGAASAGILSCLKHFPGHGAAAEDSHYASPVVRRSLEQLRSVDLLPFRRGAEAGAPAVMTAHITFPALDPSRPATFSPAAIEGLLRREMGFRGLVVSDDLEMAGSAERFPLLEGAVAALRAGADLLLVSRMFQPRLDLSRFVAELDGLLAAGVVPAERLAAARRRVAFLRSLIRRRLPPGRGVPAEELRCPEHLSLLAEVRERLGRRSVVGDA